MSDIELLNTSTVINLEATSLVFLDMRMEYETWASIGQRLQSAAGSVNWWLGDWLNFGESAYGETYTQAIAATGLSYDYLRGCKWVASQVDPATRVDNLSWTHHREVASLDVDDQAYWLEEAEANGWSASYLRDAIRSRRVESGPLASEESESTEETARAVPPAWARLTVAEQMFQDGFRNRDWGRIEEGLQVLNETIALVL